MCSFHAAAADPDCSKDKYNTNVASDTYLIFLFYGPRICAYYSNPCLNRFFFNANKTRVSVVLRRQLSSLSRPGVGVPHNFSSFSSLSPLSHLLQCEFHREHCVFRGVGRTEGGKNRRVLRVEIK